MKKLLMVFLVVFNITVANAIDMLLDMGPQIYVCEFDLGTPPDDCLVSVIPAANYFGLDANGNGMVDELERMAISQFKPLVVDGVTIQVASGSGTPAIDNPWDFFGISGIHMTTIPVSVVNADVNNDGGFTQALYFGGWSVLWNGALAPLDGGGSGPALATLTCSLAGCVTGSQFALDYSVVIGANASAGFFAEGVFYQLHYEGTVSVTVNPNSGDMNGDGLFNVVDMLLLQQKILSFQ